METEFTPLLSLFGGMLIGLAAVIVMACHGRIAGISGIVSRLLPPRIDSAAVPVSIAFIGGLLLAYPLLRSLGMQAEQTVSGNLPVLVVAGLLVGFGASVGNGCTSGHGVCGISRLSGRSIIATLTFMLTAFVTVYLARHVVGA